MFSARLLCALEISPADWERCLPGEAEGQAYYAACETAPPEGFELLAVAAYDQDRLVAFCPVFRLSYNLVTALQGGLRKTAEGFAKIFPGVLRFSLIALGSPVGERCHIGFSPDLSKACRLNAFQAMLTAVAQAAKAQKTGLIGIKDLSDFDQPLLAAALQQAGFTHISSLPIAVLDIPQSEGAYLARLSHNMRKDLRRKMNQAAAVRIERRDSILGMEAEIDALYAATRQSSALDYGEFEDLPAGYFASVMAALGPRGFLMLYYAENQLAAFNLMFRDDRRLIDKFWGMRREIARAHNLYFISWMANVRLCLQENIPLLQTGQTAYAAKLRLGSRLVPSHVWFRHRNFLVDRMLRLAARFIAFDAMDPDLKALKSKEAGK